MSERLIFVAGASGAVGRTVVRHALAAGVAIRPHYRKPPDPGDERSGSAVVGALDDKGWLVEQLRGVTTVLQLVGTTRKRFASGDTYETSDVGTTQSLVDAARAAGTVDHIVFLSSVGTGWPVGAYLRAKARAEAIVRAGALPWTIFRPGLFDGEGHRAPAGLRFLGRALGKYAPIAVDDLARAILHTATAHGPLEAILQGGALVAEVNAAK